MGTQEDKVSKNPLGCKQNHLNKRKGAKSWGAEEARCKSNCDKVMKKIAQFNQLKHTLNNQKFLWESSYFGASMFYNDEYF